MVDGEEGCWPRREITRQMIEEVRNHSIPNQGKGWDAQGRDAYTCTRRHSNTLKYQLNWNIGIRLPCELWKVREMRPYDLDCNAINFYNFPSVE